MADFSHLPLFTDAYLADTRHLTTEEHGAYLLLLMEAWRRPECSLPDDDRLLARLCGLSPDKWDEVKPVVMAFWVRDGRSKTWSQKRLSKERHYVAGKSASQRDKVLKRWEKKKKEDTTVLPEGYRDDTPTPTPTPTLEKEEAIASSKKSDRGSRLPNDWAIPDEYREAAKAMGASEHLIANEAERFRDFWIAKAGKDGVKLDWLATWRNWVRTALSNPRNKPSDMSDARRRAAAEEAERHLAAVERGKQSYGREQPAPKPQISEEARQEFLREAAAMRASASQNSTW